jgi:HAD superfamily hydrolase (TIGR01509 family)
MKKKYDLIIFDCDGTLVDSESLINLVFSEMMQDIGYTEYTYDYCIDNFVGLSYPSVVNIIINKHPDLPFKELEEKFIKATNNRIPKELKAMPNAHKVLEQLTNYKKCIASNGEKAVVKYSLELTGLIKYFDNNHIYTYELVECGKPSPDLFLYAAHKFGVANEKCLVVEDSLIGLTGAVNAGMDVIAYRPVLGRELIEQQVKNLNPKAIISNLEQLVELL